MDRNGETNGTWGNPLDRSPTMWNHCRVVQAERAEQASKQRSMTQITKKYYVVVLEDVDEVMETMRIEEEPPIDDELEAIETVVASDSATDFKGLGALHNIVLDINDWLLCSDVQMGVG